MTSTSNPTYPGPAHITASKPPGYAEATLLEAQPNDVDARLPAYSPPKPIAPWHGQPGYLVLSLERTTRRARFSERKNRTLACFMLLAILLVAIFIVVVVIEVVGHLDQ